MPRAPAFPERHPFHITFFRAGFQPHNTLGCPYHFPFSLRLAYGKSAYPERYGSRYAPPALYCESSRGAPLRFDARLNGRGQSTSSHIRQRTLPYHGLQRPCYALCVLCGIFSVWVVAYLFTCKSIYSADLEASSTALCWRHAPRALLIGHSVCLGHTILRLYIPFIDPDLYPNNAIRGFGFRNCIINIGT